jgi:hypothetical protein
MARAGGEADKLGNRYEAVWTVDSLLDVLVGEAQALTAEPLTGELGIEFIKELNDGSCEFHSVKRQTTGETWRLSTLTAVGGTGRSILQDLFDRISASPTNTACFVSTTTANQLEDLRALAAASQDVANFEARLTSQGRLKEQFENYILRVGGTVGVCRDLLRRLRVVGVTEPELVRRVEHRIRYHLYHPDCSPVDPKAVRLLLGNAILDWLGTKVDCAMVRDYLAGCGLRERDWQRDSQVRETIDRRNSVYTRDVEAELINGAAIVRTEAAAAIAALNDGSQRDVVIVGAAGLGKSCTVAQIVYGLSAAGIPHLTLRLDLQSSVLTADALGRELGYPTSPAIVLAGLANGGRCVLVIDQLDALSSASGRNQHLWTVFEELLAESRRYPQMRVLLACREFDASHDHRLMRLMSDDKRCHRINLAPLPLPDVQAAVTRAGVDPAKLTPEDLKLLQTPQNLSLFLQSGPAEHGRVGSVQALLDRYWDYKQRRVDQRLGRTSRWLDVIRTLASWLSEHQTLSAPRDILDAFDADARAMASEHVLVLEGRSARFFHESVFDYAFARTHVAAGGTAAGLLLNSKTDQHLFRRAQVRQILSYQRDRSLQVYLADLRYLLTEPKVRTHIKKLVLDLLRSLPDPKPEEWTLVKSLVNVPPCAQWWRAVPHDSVGWFDLLLSDGTWTAWLRSAEVQVVDQALWLLSQKTIMFHRSEQVAALIEPCLDGSTVWQERFRNLLRFGEPHHSRRMFDLLLLAMRSGWLDEPGDHWWHHLHDFPKKAPTHAVELLAEFVDRQCVRFPIGNPFDQKAAGSQLPGDYCSRLADEAPEDFVAQILPRISIEVGRRAHVMAYGEHRDDIWPFLVLGSDLGFDSQLLHGLGRAMQRLAATAPARLRALIDSVVASRNHTLSYLLLSAWTVNPVEFADDLTQYLSGDPYRLDIGYDVTGGGGGTGAAAVSRAAITAAAPHCSPESYAALENAILKFRDPYEQKRPPVLGFTQLLLLQCLPTARLSRTAANRIAELKSKFPDADFSQPRPMKVVTVGSPIPAEAMVKMTDEQWLSAMRKYDSTSFRLHHERGKGGLHELAMALTRETRSSKKRFAALVLKMSDDIKPEYFDAILRGLVQTKEENGDALKPGDSVPVDLPALIAAVQRVHRLPGQPSGRTICATVQKFAAAALPDDLIGMVCEYAINDPDPAEEKWQARAGGTIYYGGDPLTAGINSVRGEAAWAIGGLLFANNAHWPKVQRAVESLCGDRSVSVRSCAVKCALAILNIDRNEAVRLFLKLADGADDVLSTGDVDSFLHHSMQTHYAQLRPLLLRMLNHPGEDARASAARQITVTSFHDAAAHEDVAAVFAGDETCRVAAAGVYAYNLDSDTVGAVCRGQLERLFADPAKSVRQAASCCFRELSDENLSAESALIGTFINSPAFEDGAEQLVFALADSTALLPDVVCAIPNQIMDSEAKAGTPLHMRHGLYHLPELVLRVYRQTSDDVTKARCLATMDRMLEAGLIGLELELGKMER